MNSQDLTNKKVFLFDLDSTITREELLPRIAKLNNTFDELKLLTREAMLNGSDLESSFRDRVSSIRYTELISDTT